jgi:polysaccharide export outer membrane protein
MRVVFAILLAMASLLVVACAPSMGKGAYVAKDGGSMSRDGEAPKGAFQRWSDGSVKADQVGNVLPPAPLDTNPPYLIGPGDRFGVTTQGRPDASVGDVIVSPDGSVSMPLVGVLVVKGLTVQALTDSISGRLKALYENPQVAVLMKEYANNRVFVFGRVQNPGVVNFQGKPTFLEAIARSGGLSGVDKASQDMPSRCLVNRGNSELYRIDLKALLEDGDLRYNIVMQNNDVIFIPQNTDQLVYVLGEVTTPGTVVMGGGMSLFEALMKAGGPGRDAENTVYVIRQASLDTGFVETLNLSDLLARADFRANVRLAPGDIVYVPQTGFSKFSYNVTKLLPILETLFLGSTLSSRAGATTLVQQAFLSPSGGN